MMANSKWQMAKQGIQRRDAEGAEGRREGGMTKTILKWPGGKRWLLRELLPMIPPKGCFVDLFGGAGSVLFAREATGVEVYNDTHEGLVNLFRVVKFHYQALVQEFEFSLNSRADFIARRDATGETDIQRAGSFLFLNALSFGGDGDSFGVQKTKGGGAARHLGRVLDRVYALKDRLADVIIEQKDWRDCLSVYDSPESFFFADPPYIGGEVPAYRAWTMDELRGLAEALAGARGKWLLTINDSKEVRGLFKGCRMRGFARQRGIANKTAGEREVYRELVVAGGNGMDGRYGREHMANGKGGAL